MLYINCPHCGMRSQNEFSYGGDASVKRPELNKEVSDQEWDNFVYNRKSLRGKHLELWQHISGCRQWIKVERDTATHEINQTMRDAAKWVFDEGLTSVTDFNNGNNIKTKICAVCQNRMERARESQRDRKSVV